MTKKVICIIRTSTKRQEIEAQKMETIEYAKSFGYTDDEIVIIGGIGLSARKVDDKYLDNLNLLYSTIENTPTIERVVAWACDRVARKGWMFMQLIDFLLNKKVNFNVKNPQLFLLNADCTENSGMRTTLTLLATQAELEMEQKFARFKRAKDENKRNGKYNGGKVKFGYSINKDGYFVIDEKESKIVKLIYDLYSSGEYTYSTLKKEIEERGINISYNKMTRIIKETCYFGDRNYPSFIDKEVWEKCKKVRGKNNTMKSKESVNKKYGTKIVKCLECGHNYIYALNGKNHMYTCIHKKFYKNFDKKEPCNSADIKSDVMDMVLLREARKAHIHYLEDLANTTSEEIRNKISILENKLIVANNKIPTFKEQKRKLALTYAKGLLDDKDLENETAKITTQEENNIINIDKYKKEIKQLNKILDDVQSPSLATKIKIGEKIINNVFSKNEEDFNKMVKQHIKVAYVTNHVLDNHHFKAIFVVLQNNEIITYVYHYGGQCAKAKSRRLIDINSYIIIHGEPSKYTTWLDEQIKDDFQEIRNIIKDDIEKVKSKL